MNTSTELNPSRWSGVFIQFGYPIALATWVIILLEGSRLCLAVGNGVGSGFIGVMGLMGCFSLSFLSLGGLIGKSAYLTFKPKDLGAWIFTLSIGTLIELWSIHQATLIWTRRLRQTGTRYNIRRAFFSRESPKPHYWP